LKITGGKCRSLREDQQLRVFAGDSAQSVQDFARHHAGVRDIHLVEHDQRVHLRG
jgi:hypothetical protein